MLREKVTKACAFVVQSAHLFYECNFPVLVHHSRPRSRVLRAWTIELRIKSVVQFLMHGFDSVILK